MEAALIKNFGGKNNEEGALSVSQSLRSYKKNTNYTANYHKSTHHIFILYFCTSLPPFS